MSIGIDELFDMISWNSSEEKQKKGIELAKSVECYSVFLQPHGLKHSKDVWENCAQILASYPDEILKYYSDGLLRWLEDMNWPGAETIFNRLLEFKETSFLSLFIVDCVKEALVCDRISWLGNMSALLENEYINETCLPKDIYNVLYRRYHHTL